jgi:hypothetical protein
MSDDEEYSLAYLGRQAWGRYNPSWLIDKIDESVRANPTNNDDEVIFTLADVREAYYAGFKTGAVYKITKEIPYEGEKRDES